MPDDPTPDPAAPIDTEGDDDGDHSVPTDLVEIHEAVDYLERTKLGPNPDPAQ